MRPGGGRGAGGPRARSQRHRTIERHNGGSPGSAPFLKLGNPRLSGTLARYEPPPQGAEGRVHIVNTDPRDIISKSPMTAMQVIIIAITVGLNGLDGFDVLSISYASPGIATEWGIDRAALGLVLVAELVGMAIGSIVPRRRRRQDRPAALDAGMSVPHGGRHVHGHDDRQPHRALCLARYHGARYRRYARGDQCGRSGVLERAAQAPERLDHVDRVSGRRRSRRHVRLVVATRLRLALRVLFRLYPDDHIHPARLVSDPRVGALAHAQAAGRCARKRQRRVEAYRQAYRRRVARGLRGNAQALGRRYLPARAHCDHADRRGGLLLPHHDVLLHLEVGARYRHADGLRSVLGRRRAHVVHGRRRDGRRDLRVAHVALRSQAAHDRRAHPLDRHGHDLRPDAG